MEIDKDYLRGLRAHLEAQKAQAIAQANQAAGALALLDTIEAVPQHPAEPQIGELPGDEIKNVNPPE